MHQQTCTRWAQNSKEWRLFGTAHRAPTWHGFIVGNKWVFSFTKMVREPKKPRWSANQKRKRDFFCAFSLRERRKLQKISGSASSHLVLHCFWDWGAGVCEGGYEDADNGLPVLGWPNSCEAIRRFPRIIWFTRIMLGFRTEPLFLRIALQATKNLRVAGLRRFAWNRSNVMPIGVFSESIRVANRRAI